MNLVVKKTSNFGAPDVPTSFLIKRRYHPVNEMIKLKAMWYVSVVLEPFIPHGRTLHELMFLLVIFSRYFPALYANQMLV